MDDSASRLPDETMIEARRIVVGGRVQGVGFRPFVYRLAEHHRLVGWVQNQAGEVEIIAQGQLDALERFIAAVIDDAPPLARPRLIAVQALTCEAHDAFVIRMSEEKGRARIHVPPDYFACEDCLAELRDPADRRYRYPFINCTQCGPRYTLIRRLPYDRPNTTMAAFPLCPDCRGEYTRPNDRRFHAEPIACAVCGPQLRFVARDSLSEEETQAALAATVTALKRGQIVAVKGIGGYHLLCDARNPDAVARLRAHKPRPHKPLAVMFPWEPGLKMLHDAVRLDDAHEQCLRDPMRPIVLVPKRSEAALASAVAPGLDEVGVMLPYSPLHHLLLEDFGGPVVATSANISGEPVLTEGNEVEGRLAAVAEAYLHHDRPIERPADDPVYRVIAGRPRPLRLGRGGAPLELTLPFSLSRPLLAVGGHMKNTLALAWDDRVVVSPHIGDMGAPRSLVVFEQVARDLQALYGVRASALVCDAHPDYATSRWAQKQDLPLTKVFHHHAHAAALAGEYPDVENWLVFTWDGVGLGVDGTLWGGEALLGRPGRWQRRATWRPFYLFGGERAAREPWRSACALAWETGHTWDDGPEDIALAYEAWRRRLNSPATSAVGRLFDAASALVGLIDRASFEGQGPMYLETKATGGATAVSLPQREREPGLWETDWAPLVPYLLDKSRAAEERAAGFHESLAHALCNQACRLREAHRIDAVGLGGGVFQNRVLTERAVALLEAAGFTVKLAERIPVNDAGLSYGQIIEAGSGH